MSDYWMVRAGRNAVHFDTFLDEQCMFVGFGGRLGESALRADRAELTERLSQLNPDWSSHKASNAAGQLYRFVHEVKGGDRVVTYDPSQRRYLVGIVGGPATFEDDSFVRPVAWTQRVARDGLSVGTRNTLGAIQTIFRLGEQASEEFERRAVALDAPEATPTPAEPIGPADSDPAVADVVEDSLEKSREFVEDRIASLDAYQMQDLVAGILRALGYKTQVAGRGADRGVDIFASPDGLGLEEPRIFVEVKHRPNSAMGTQEVRSFMGGRQQGDRCLFVSTGGFSKEARYEADRSNVPLTLIGLPQLRELLLEHYDSVDAETKRLVPLVRMYWPASND